MRKKLPEWLKRGIVDTDTTRTVRKILKFNHLNTVCDSARCPNKNECYSKNTATFMILGTNCTRNCRFCSITNNPPEAVNVEEPLLIANAIKELGLDYVVITSVTRDDLEDEGAGHFAETIREIKKIGSDIKIEVLTPDFNGKEKLIDIVISEAPDVFNHNIETVKDLYKRVRPQAQYQRSLDFLEYIKKTSPTILTKTGMMVGLGETEDQIISTLKDLQAINCDIVTIGQYIQPTKNHLDVEKYYTPEEFEHLQNLAKEIGIKFPIAGPLVRSSYKAKEVLLKNI
ncbi:MAG: lipoyl synthase [bacterium]